VRLNTSVCGFNLPELYLLTFALLIVASHELPEQIVERLVLERILRCSNSKRDMIRTRKRPRITNPTGQKRDHRRRDVVRRQRRTITKSDFHVRWWQWSNEHLRDAAVRTFRSDQKRPTPLTVIALHEPASVGPLDLPC